MRIRLDLGYDGTDFSGWAIQPGRRTVEGELSAALATVLRQEIKLTVAGRTDAGVHARGQVAHFELSSDDWATLRPQRPKTEPLPPGAVLGRRLNGLLPDDIVVYSAEVAPEHFDARFGATHRRYSYRVADARTRLDPLRRRDTATVREPLDVDVMQQAAQNLLGLNDFAAFCKLAEGRSTIRTLLRYDWRRDPDGTLVATIEADAFCHSMVRFLVGTLVAVGAGRRPPQWPAEVLAARARDGAVHLMPARGLCLEEVGYPEDHLLAERAAATRAVRTLDPPPQPAP